MAGGGFTISIKTLTGKVFELTDQLKALSISFK